MVLRGVVPLLPAGYSGWRRGRSSTGVAMRLVSFKIDGQVRIGAVIADKVLPLNTVLSVPEQVPDDMTAFLAAGEPAMQAARKAVETFEQGAEKSAAIDLKDADLQAPVPRPGKIL